VLPVVGAGLLVLLCAVAGACFVRWLNAAWPGQEEAVVQMAGLAGVAGIVLPVVVYVGLRRRTATAGRAGLIVLAALGTVLTAFYLSWSSYYVEFPADILGWSEGDFVNDIIKFCTGYPLYTAQVNNDSFHYTPGAQLLTYALAWLCGMPHSIPAYRLIQLVYTLTASVVAVGCYWRLRQLSGAARSSQGQGLWTAAALPLFFLIATNSITNPFAYALHNDALAQLVAMLAYWLLLDYAVARRPLTLIAMAVIPAAGFFVKQNLAIWGPLYFLYLLFCDAPRSVLRATAYVVAAGTGLGLILAGGYGLWGEPFWYWTVREMAGHRISAMRSLQHLLTIWPYYAMGLFGGIVLLRGANARRLAGPWLIWLLFLLAETYTSGIEWLLNHMGPGSLVAGIWFLAALTQLWSADALLTATRPPLVAWARAALGVGLICLVYAGLGIVCMPIRPLPADAYRYVEDIEREVAGLAPDRVLLDVGDWIRARHGIVMRDAAPGIGSRGASREKGDFSGILARLEERHYRRILVRRLDAPGFWYDNETGWWPQSTGIRKALREHYQEVSRIKPVVGERRFMPLSFEPMPATRYGFDEITVLVPKPLRGASQADVR